MIPIRNDTGFPHFWFEKLGTNGEPFKILVVRGTYELTSGGAPVPLAEVQDPICLADEYRGPVEQSPLESVLFKDGDLVSFKPSTDLTVVGRARPPGGVPTESWTARVALGAMEKRLRLTGPRRFVRGDGGWRVTDPRPVDSVDLDYRFAFGGAFTVLAEELPGGETEYLTKQDNPAGQGWLPSAEDFERVSAHAAEIVRERVAGIRETNAPQIEDPDEPILSPEHRAPAQGFGPLARWWGPRIRLAGTYDQRWRDEVAPRFPADFDARFYQSAPPDLISPRWLSGDEELTLEGVLAAGDVTMRLPGRVLVAAAKRQSGEISAGRMQLDTVAVDLGRGTVNLVWRGAFSTGDPAVAVHLRDVTGDARDAREQEA